MYLICEATSLPATADEGHTIERDGLLVRLSPGRARIERAAPGAAVPPTPASGGSGPPSAGLAGSVRSV